MSCTPGSINTTRICKDTTFTNFPFAFYASNEEFRNRFVCGYIHLVDLVGLKYIGVNENRGDHIVNFGAGNCCVVGEKVCKKDNDTTEHYIFFVKRLNEFNTTRYISPSLYELDSLSSLTYAEVMSLLLTKLSLYSDLRSLKSNYDTTIGIKYHMTEIRSIEHKLKEEIIELLNRHIEILKDNEPSS